MADGGKSAADSGGLGPLLVASACLCWAIDNNLTRKVSSADAVFIAGSKGLVAGLTNTALAVVVGVQWPPTGVTASALLLGLAGYGISLVFSCSRCAVSARHARAPIFDSAVRRRRHLAVMAQ